ncbi:MAG: DNA methyltransferase, partial [Halanaerobium sp.]
MPGSKELKKAIKILKNIKSQDKVEHKKKIKKIKKLCSDILQANSKNKDKGKYSDNNILNDLTGKEWIKFTKSWFVHNPPPRSKNEILHPAKFPEDMIEDFIKFFTKSGQIVLDPFMGTGSTLVACENTGRKGYGIELIKKYYDIAKDRIKEINGHNKHKLFIEDSQEIDTLWKDNNLDKVDFVITSPPYWNMLKKSRGNVKSN